MAGDVKLDRPGSEYPGPRRRCSCHATPGTYRVSSWDHEADNWHVEAIGLSPMALRGPVRGLLARGYDRDASILVEREEAARGPQA